MVWLKYAILILPNRFYHLPRMEKRLTIKAFGGLVLARLALRLLPFRLISPFLGQLMEKTSSTCSDLEKARSIRVARAIRRVSRYLPIKCTCLVQAITGNVILGSEGIPSTLYLGVNRSNAGLTAHAWLRCGDLFLTGGSEQKDFVAVATFAKFRKPL
jgi:hypothetical protein